MCWRTLLPVACLAVVNLGILCGCQGASSAVEDGERESAKGRTASPPTAVSSESDEPPLSDIGTRPAGDDWPTFLGPTRDSKSQESPILSPWPEQGLKVVWEKEKNTGYGIGSVAKGRYFHFDRFDQAIRRPGQARLICFAAETGEELWRFEYTTDYSDLLGYNNGPRCSPLIDGNRVYIYGAEGMLHCIRASDGELIWKLDTAKEYGVVQNFFGVGSTPVIENDLLICMVGGSPPGSPGLYESRGAVEGNGTGIVAFDKHSGVERYRLSDELASYASLQLATIDERRWCFAFARGGLLGFEPTSGKMDFHYPWRARDLESVNASMPVVVGNQVFVSETYRIGSSLVAVRPGEYDVVWSDPRNRRDKAMKTHWNTAVQVDGYLYGCSGRNEPDADLRCIEWKTGRVVWVEQDPPETRERSSLLYADGHFIVLGETGTLRLIKANPREYELVSQINLRKNKQPLVKLSDPYWAAPILSHGLLYLHGEGRVLCMELIPTDRSGSSADN